MTRTFRHVLMSTSLGLAAAVLQMPGAQAQDSTSCMQDVQMLREQASLGKGGDSSIEASASAAEEACLVGDYGQASAYIADAQRRMNLREAQRDDFGATTDDTQEANVTAGTGFGTDVDGDSVADNVEDAVDDADDDLDDFGNDVEDAADDVGDEVSDVADDIGDEVDDLFGEDENVPNTPATRAATRALLGREPAPGEPTATTSVSLRGETAAADTGGTLSLP